jgi:hypothetical protein
VGCLGLTTTAGDLTMLSVCTTGPDADVGLIGHRMAQLAVQLGKQLGTAERRPEVESGSVA